MEEIQKELSLNSWEGFADLYLKAEDLKDKFGSLLVDSVKIENSEDGQRIVLYTTVGNKEYKFPLNKTNTRKLMEKVNSPREIVGKTILWEKYPVRNPKTNMMQDGILVTNLT